MKNLRSYWNNIKTSTKLLVAFTLLACGPMPLDWNEYVSYFLPETANRPIETKHYLFRTNFSSYETDFDDTYSLIAKENVKDWLTYFKSGVSEQTLDLMYEEKKTRSLAKSFSKSYTKAAVYFNHAADIEDLLLERSWNPDYVMDKVAVEALIKKIKLSTSTVKDSYLNQRYDYQLMRLEAVLNNHKEVVNLFNISSKQNPNRGLIYQWQKAKAAGSRLILGDTARAVLEFSEVFHDCPSKRKAAGLSVNNLSNEVFENAFDIATNDQEKANILALQAVNSGIDGLENMKKIVELNPNHQLLELLMSREINKNEVDFYAEKSKDLPADYYYNYYDNSEEDTKAKRDSMAKKGVSYLEKLLDFSTETAKNKKLKSSNYWYLCSAYLQFMKNNFKACEANFNKLANVKDSSTLRQVNFLKFIVADKTYNTKNEAILLSTIENVGPTNSYRINNMKIEMSRVLHNFYLQKPQNEVKESGYFWSCSKPKKIINATDIQAVKSFLASNMGSNEIEEYGYDANQSQSDLLDTCSSVFLEKVRAFMLSNTGSPNDKKLIELANLKFTDLNVALIRSKIKDERYEEALAEFKQLSEEEIIKMVPEDILLNTAKAFKKDAEPKPISVLEYLQELIVKKNKALGTNATASDLYEYGKAMYNLSYNGNAWILRRRYWSVSDLHQKEFLLNNTYFDNHKAKEYFDMALAKNPNKEFAAKICYAGALCEDDAFWMFENLNEPEDYKLRNAFWEKSRMDVLPKYQSYFKMINDKYSDTQYAKYLLEECSIYRDYVSSI